MTETDRAILGFEHEHHWWKYRGSKEAQIRERFGLSATGYYQRLVRLLGDPEAEAYRPAVVRRLRSRVRRAA